MHLEEEPPAWEHQMMTGSPLPLSPSPPDEPSKKKDGGRGGDAVEELDGGTARRGGTSAAGKRERMGEFYL
jgi:hypothetical protein